MRRAAILFVAICLTGGVTGRAKADGTIILNSVSDFQQNIGFISGIGSSAVSPNQQTASNAALATAFPDLSMASPTLHAVNSTAVSNDTVGGLLNFSATPSALQQSVSQQYVSAWTYGYHIDPDLTNYTIKLGLVIPQVSHSFSDAGINMVTIALTSVTENSSNQPVYRSRVWGFDNVLDPTILAPDTTTNLEEFSLAAVDGAGAGRSNYFNQDPGFDIQKVLYVSIGYRSVFNGAYPVTPMGTRSLWTGAAALDVVQTPEPSSAVVLACGLGCATLLRVSLRMRSRRRRSL